jgi:hypothetical protein
LRDAPQDEVWSKRLLRIGRGRIAGLGALSLYSDCINNEVGAGGASGRFDKSQASASISGARHCIANPSGRNLL